MRRIEAVMAVFIVSVLLAVPLASAGFNSANTIIVLPTTKVVNNTPLHINEDAIAGAKLGAFLVLNGIETKTYTKTVKVPVEYHSVLISDENQTYVLTSDDMPDLGLNFGTEPVGDAVVLRVNFSRVLYNSTKHAAEFLDRSVEIIFNENTTPLDIGGNYKVVYTNVDGRDVMYFYNYQYSTGNTSSLGDWVKMGSWKIHFIDIDTNQMKTLVELYYPGGSVKLTSLLKGTYYLMYILSNGTFKFESYTSSPTTEIDTLLKEGAKEIFLFTPTDFFIGINQAKMVTYDYWFYKKVRQYGDGDVYSGQWVWDIQPENNLYVLYLHVNGTEYPTVFVGSNSALQIPIKSWNLKLVPVFNRTADGGAITGILGYRFVRTTYVTKSVSITAPAVTATNDVNSLIVNDTYILDNGLPKDKNVVIIGGWVSNKAWEVLEKAYGTDKVNELKNELMSKGYIVAKLKNPYNPNYYVVILAGKTYRETAKAVEEFIKSAG
ncbi:S-layer protein [Thermococcus sp. 21S9]|uniref:S-layer protein n=1 Tax=Thermococcus sp. 21S9 TaxID=1638223 RepID=UPI00143C6FEB|nr:S-layer protein [Thermococcus sp. 21S9]NJE54790.1 S-layer protein [Thermococcus sp. 21S9]